MKSETDDEMALTDSDARMVAQRQAARYSARARELLFSDAADERTTERTLMFQQRSSLMYRIGRLLGGLD